MANKRFEQIGIQPFRTRPLLAEGLLAVPREGGDLERRVAQGLFNLSAYVGEQAAAKAEKQNTLAGGGESFAGRVRSTIVQDDGIPAVAADGKPVKAKPAGQTAAYARDRYMKVHGLPVHMAAALAGHGQAESGFNPNAVGDNGTAIGFYQWRGNRAANLKAFAKQRGKHWKDTDTQLDFVVHELKNSEGLAWRALQKARTVDEATAAFMHFERPQGWTIANPRGGHNFSGRLAYAQGLLGANAPQPGAPDDVPLPPPAAGAAPDDDGITLSGGTWRPTGRDTVGGRAYDKAGIKTYLNTLEAEVTRTTGQVFRKFRNDPAKMEQAFDSLRREFLSSHVFPEIAVDFEVAYLGQVNSYLNAADNEAADRAKQADTAAFTERTNSLESEQQQAIAGMDPKNPAVADEIARQQQGIDAHYDEAVTRGLISADHAAKDKIASRRTAALGFYEKQAESLDADGIKTMRESMEADFADGGIDGLDGAGWQALKDGLTKVERTKRIDADGKQEALTDAGEVFAGRIAAGFDINKDEWAQYRMDGADNPEALAATEAKIGIARAIRGLPLNEAAKKVEVMRAAAGDAPDSATLRTLGFAEKALADKAKVLKDDPLTHGEQMKLVPPSGSLSEAAASGGDAVSAALMARAKAAQTLEAHYGTPVRLLKPGEAKELAAIAKADPARGAELAGALVEGAGNRALAVLSELGDSAPMMAGAGFILANGGNPQAAEDALAGQSSDIKVKLKPATAAAAWTAATGDALAYQDADGKRIRATAHSIARKRIDDAGVDPDSDEAGVIYRQAVNEAAGGTNVNGVQYGGFADMTLGSGWFDGRDSRTIQVLVPPSIRADLLPDVIGAITDDDLLIKPVGGAAQLATLVPVAVKGGFAFHDGDSDNPAFLQADNGRVFILDIVPLRKRLAPRVPGAFQ